MVLIVSLCVLKRCRAMLGTPALFVSPPVSLCVSGAFPSFVAAVCRVWWFVVSFFLVRLLLSVWLLLPGPRFGRGCGSVVGVWRGWSVCVFGGCCPASELSLPLAWELVVSGFRS